MPDKTCIFIDGSNFYHGLKKNIGKTSVNFEALNYKLTVKASHIRTFYYNAPYPYQLNAPRAQSQQRFFNYIRSVPDTDLILGRLETRPSGELVEKGVDVKLASDMIRLAYDNEYDRGIVISCDGDFVPAIQFIINELGKLVTVAFVDGQKGYHIKKTCTSAIKIDNEFLKDIWR
ncbi:MAG: NYN domain-containing protein [Actinomycetia bacterium]|nr:NYN domain-containing protein [Actinomycetes bacterium]